MESLNKVNGIVEQNQWNRRTKSMEWFFDIGEKGVAFWRFFSLKMQDCRAI